MESEFKVLLLYLACMISVTILLIHGFIVPVTFYLSMSFIMHFKFNVLSQAPVCLSYLTAPCNVEHVQAGKFANCAIAILPMQSDKQVKKIKTINTACVNCLRV